MSSSNFGKTTSLLFIFAAFFAVACLPQSAAPSPTVQAVVDHAQLLPEQIEVLQDEAYGSGRILLYTWQYEGKNCLASSYMTSINGAWELSDTLSMPCQQSADFVAGYTNVSNIETNLGSPRQTVAYGTSHLGDVVRVIWADGLVEQVPIRNNSFLTVRSGRWAIEQIDLINANGSIIRSEDWINSGQISG